MICLCCRATLKDGYEGNRCPFCLMPFDGSVPPMSPVPRISRRGGRGSGKSKLAKIGNRDDWICHLCGERVDPNLKAPHPKSATVDHLVPRSQGGSNRGSNLKLAHQCCNIARGCAPL